jgi:O-antigen/teichoic acid export membrane protein
VAAHELDAAQRDGERMTILRKTVRNISIVAASQAVMWLAAFVFTIAQARYLGPVRFGELALALSYGTFLSILIDFGLNVQLNRIVAQRRDGADGALAATLVIRTGLWLVGVPLLALATLLFDYSPELRGAIFVISVSVLLLGFGNTMVAYLQGQDEFVIPSVAQIAQRLTVAGIGLLVLMASPSVSALAGAFVAGSVMNVAILLVGSRRHGWVWRRPDRGTVRTLFGTAIPLAVFWIATTVYGNVDMIMLERLAPATNVGWYAAAYRLFFSASIVPMIVAGVVLYPMLSRLSLGSRAELRMVIDKAFKCLVLSGFGVALAIVLFAEPLMAALYPVPAYAPAANTLRLLAPGLLFGYVNTLLSYTLFALHQERRLLTLALAFAVLNPLANLVAIPLLAQDGAAVATSLTELGVLLGLLRLMPSDLLSRADLAVAAKAGLAAAAGALIAALVGEQSPLAILLSLAGYLIAALGVRAIAPSDLRSIFELLGARRPAVVAADAVARATSEELR